MNNPTIWQQETEWWNQRGNMKMLSIEKNAHIVKLKVYKII